MPIYEYSCKKCGAVTEALVKNHKTKPALTCKKCGGKNFTKEISSPSIAKGSSSQPDCGYSPSTCHSCCGGACNH